MINEQILKGEEQAVYVLRSLYRSFSYSQYKMSKFEEYDLYGRNKAFLVSDEIITFTDTRGKLMALKPDVTLSIIKNSTDKPGAVQKMYYNESVYRLSNSTGEFKEIMQTGLECLGDIGLYHICEVLTLAVKSLEYIDENYILDLSHAGLVAALLEENCPDEELKEKILKCIQRKNTDEAAKLPGISRQALDLAKLLTVDYCSFEDAKRSLGDYLNAPKAKKAMDEFGEVYAAMQDLGLTDKINIDFSVVNDMGYYSGVVFKGYIKGIPTSILSGGQYDKLMQKMGRHSGAIGFAVYLDGLERFNPKPNKYDSDCVILIDSKDRPSAVIKAVERLSKTGESVAALTELPANYICKKIFRFEGEELVEINGNA